MSNEDISREDIGFNFNFDFLWSMSDEKKFTNIAHMEDKVKILCSIVEKCNFPDDMSLEDKVNLLCAIIIPKEIERLETSIEKTECSLNGLNEIHTEMNRNGYRTSLYCSPSGQAAINQINVDVPLLEFLKGILEGVPK